MKRVFLHSKRVIGNHWFIICLAGAISFVFGIGLFLIFLVYSLYFKADPVDVNDLMNNKKLEKWIQEVTLGQANGNNSFRKYSYAIR